jgi:hypothetical protein
MTTRQQLLAMTAAAGLIALPGLVFAQGSAGSSMQPQTTQTTPQQGPLAGSPGARAGANAGQATTQTIPGNNAGSGMAQNRDASGGVMAQGTTPSPRDGTPGNPPSTATQRAVDSVTGNRTPPDGTPGNPPGTAVGRALDSHPNTSATAPHTTGTTTTSTTTTTTGATTGAVAVDSAALRNGRRASKVIGSTVYNENNESIGEVDDILIPPGGGAPVAVVSVGGFLGIGAKLVAVPYDRLQMNTDRNRWTMTGATKDSLTSLPTFTYDTAAERRG